MITEDYVSFENAKLLKEKGFDELCHYAYMPNGQTFYMHRLSDYPFERNSNITSAYSAPTLQMAMKWLRKVHNRHISIEHSYILNKYRIRITQYNPNNKSDLNNTLYFSIGYDFSTYEEACEEAIKYCLENLI